MALVGGGCAGSQGIAGYRRHAWHEARETRESKRFRCVRAVARIAGHDDAGCHLAPHHRGVSRSPGHERPALRAACGRGLQLRLDGRPAAGLHRGGACRPGVQARGRCLPQGDRHQALGARSAGRARPLVRAPAAPGGVATPCHGRARAGVDACRGERGRATSDGAPACATRSRRAWRSRCVSAPGQVVEERQASPGVAAVASAFGEPGVVGAVDLDEAVADRNERARFEMAVDEAPPP